MQYQAASLNSPNLSKMLIIWNEANLSTYIDACRQDKSPLTGKTVQLVAAGGILDGRDIAAALAMGAGAVWVGTRFVTARESAASKLGKKAIIPTSKCCGLLTDGTYRIIDAGFEDTMRSTIWTGRPLRALATPYIRHWDLNRRDVIGQL
ncbi:hypothetical protein N7501_009291 [Penicillium viridicatum]|nr:hypothetical protein N7501_009291 [Penicillium viridicatum]